MSDEFQKFVDLISQVEFKVNNRSFVHFNNENGIIIKISNESDVEDSETSCITVDHKVVEPIMAGEHSMDDYRVLFNAETKNWVVKKTTMTQEMYNPEIGKFFHIDEFNPDADLTVIKDNRKLHWRVKASETFKEEMRIEDNNITGVIHFSITTKDNPHELHRTLEVNLRELLDSEPSFPFYHENEGFTDYSVFTANFFDSYSYRIQNGTNL